LLLDGFRESRKVFAKYFSFLFLLWGEGLLPRPRLISCSKDTAR
jgi:hypothetical protein